MTSFWLILDALLTDVQHPDTLFLFTTDHGHVGANAADTLYINERWPELAGCLAKSPKGATIWPNGSPRDMFLHVKPGRRAAVQGLLTEKLAGIADVLTVERALGEGTVRSRTRARGIAPPFRKSPCSPALVISIGGASHFLMKRLRNVRTEMPLHVLSYNMKRAMTILTDGRLRRISVGRYQIHKRSCILRPNLFPFRSDPLPKRILAL